MHARIFGATIWRVAEYNVSLRVQQLMSNPLPTITFRFRDPVDCILGLLKGGPLSAKTKNMAFTPEASPFYDDYVNGERIERIYAKLPPNTHALTCVLYFDRYTCAM